MYICYRKTIESNSGKSLSDQVTNDISPILQRSMQYPMLEVSINKIVEQNKLEVLVHKAR